MTVLIVDSFGVHRGVRARTYLSAALVGNACSLVRLPAVLGRGGRVHPRVGLPLPAPVRLTRDRSTVSTMEVHKKHMMHCEVRCET